MIVIAVNENSKNSTAAGVSLKPSFDALVAGLLAVLQVCVWERW